MTRVEYDLLREQEPHLRLPPWPIDPHPKSLFVRRVEDCTREQLIGRRMAHLLASNLPDWILYTEPSPP